MTAGFIVSGLCAGGEVVVPRESQRLPLQFIASIGNFRIGIFGPNSERDSAAGGELRDYGRLARRACFYEVVENAVRYCFVERALVSIRCEIKFERLAFDAQAIRDVIDVDSREIRLSRDWANRSEIVRFKMDPVIAARRGIRESLEPCFCWRSGNFHFAPSKECQSTCAFCFCHGDIKFA